ncbi:PH domain-containing protein [Paenibacillus turpanensis]|uniref:PH domain-containing protein n=1 Tax=Paenibacillus turpanensis TaxID=2689078 RepID=UPI0014090FE8|nr:PH domain-containing protein [Paenibacillus turpanensis]
MKFQSRKDWWLTFILWGSMLLLIGIGGFTLFAGEFHLSKIFVVFPLMIVFPIFMLWMWLTTFYVIDDSHLLIRYGPFKKNIPLSAIVSVKNTTNPSSSPALSLQRLEIAYNRYDSVLVSPQNRDQFLELLSKRCPNVKLMS